MSSSTPASSVSASPDFESTETANVIHSEHISESDLMRQERALDCSDRTKESFPQDPSGISRIESQIQERDSQANAPCQDGNALDKITFNWIETCFGAEFDSTPASASHMSAEGKTLIFKAPKPQAVKDTHDADLALVGMSPGKVPEDTKSEIREGQPAPEMDTWVRKGRMTNPSPEAIDNKQSIQRKLFDSLAKHGVNQEEERCLLPFTDNENDDDYETLRRLYWYTLNQRTFIFQRGAFVPDFENGVTKYINEFLDSKITTDQCKKKVMELREKFLYFMELNGNEDLNGADFCLPRQYRMFQMFKIVWGADRGRGGSGSVADQGVNVGNQLQGGSVANVKSGADKELDADMASTNPEHKARDETKGFQVRVYSRKSKHTTKP